MTNLSLSLLTDAVDASMPLAAKLFDEIGRKTADTAGVSREPYSPAEQIAVDVLTEAARSLELEIAADSFGNGYFTLPGSDRGVPGWLVGSHVDSVPSGGNYDGLAGVIAGITALAALRRAGSAPACDITVMGIRAEELSSWYGGHHGGHIGSRAALGSLPAAELDSAVNSRSGRALREHMRAAGFDPELVGKGVPYLSPDKFRGYLELHIEQGPVLENREVPVGVVTAIRGAARARSCRCLGTYTHSGAVPHEYRSDAVMAAVELVRELDLEWERVRAAGGDLVFTVGQFFTDSRVHALTKVPGEANFSLDIRSQSEATLKDMAALAERLARDIAARRRVRFDFGYFSLQSPAVMDAGFRSQLIDGACVLEIPHMEIPSGAGHDAQDFAHAGFPAAMIFVRNAHGSHNPDEAMDIADFALGTRLLAWMLAQN
ncbi:MAG: hydantoinase/carbamoylase family amidase [Betaproteobacteria bacterium]|nr:hydantoinase/carbamoylase family amidase [Betaproteobacteria bacterium]